MFALLSTILSGIFSGGATGLLGVALSRYFDLKKQQQDLELVKLNNQAALETRKLELDAQERIANRSADAQERVADADAQAREAEAAERSYQASLGADKATYIDTGAVGQLINSSSRWARFVGGVVSLGLGFVDVLRGSIRPGVTIYALVLETILLLWVRDLYDRSLVSFSVDQRQELSMHVIHTATYLVTTCTVWWFGVRPAQRP